jgi:hypothetical protein
MDVQKIWVALDDRVGSTVRVLVPAVCRANLELAELRLNLLHLRKQLSTSEIFTVQRLRAYGDGVDLVSILRSVTGNGSSV